MKKTLYTTLILIALSSNSNAQITPNSYVVGGSSLYSFVSPGNSLVQQFSTQFGIAPKFGKFVSEKWLLETSIGYSYYRYYYGTATEYNDLKVNGVSTLFGATRFFPIADRFYFTFNPNIQLGYYVQTNTSKTDTDDIVSKSTQYQTGLQLVSGLSYFVSKKWSVQATIGSFDYVATFNSNNTIGHQLGYSFVGNSFGIGMRYVLGTEK